MSRDENPPFERGETWEGDQTADATNLGLNIIGKEWVFEDIDPDNPSQLRTNRPVRCRAVRNTSGIALLPKRLVKFSTVDGEYGNSVDGYATETAKECYPVDEFLPAAGVADDKVFWIVVEGPAMVTVGLTAGATTNFARGDWLVSQTAATSQATTAGRAEQINMDAATEPLGDQVLNRIGRALTARTTANTGSDVLVDVGKW